MFVNLLTFWGGCCSTRPCSNPCWIKLLEICHSWSISVKNQWNLKLGMRNVIPVLLKSLMQQCIYCCRKILTIYKWMNSSTFPKRSRIASESNIVWLCARLLVCVASNEISTDLSYRESLDSGAVEWGLATTQQLMVSCWLSLTQIRNKSIFFQIQMEKISRFLCGVLAAHLALDKLTRALVTKVFQSKVRQLLLSLLLYFWIVASKHERSAVYW